MLQLLLQSNMDNHSHAEVQICALWSTIFEMQVVAVLGNFWKGVNEFNFINEI